MSLTYLLHIIIRYELEKDLISGALDVDDARCMEQQI